MNQTTQQTEDGGAHTKEPWTEIPMSGTCCMNLADYNRIIACVNALAGMNPEALPKVVEALTDCIQSMDYTMRKHGDEISGTLKLSRDLTNAHTALALLTARKGTSV